MPKNALTCVVFPDLLPWEKEAIAPLFAELSAKHRVVVIPLAPSKPNLRGLVPKVDGEGPLWICARNWEAAARWSWKHTGPVFLSALSLTRAAQPLPLLLLNRMRSPVPPRAHLIAHSPLNLRFFREMERLKEDRTSFLHLPCLEGEPMAGAAGRPVTVGTLARFSSESNLNYIVNVAHYVVGRRPEVRFRLLGAGGLHEHLVRMVKDLDLEGRVEVLKAGSLQDLRSLDILLYTPLRNDHFIPLMTAGSMGIPVLAAEIPGLEELVTDGKEGFVVPVNETKPMAELVLRLVGDPHLRRSMGGGLRARLRERFSVKALMAEYERLFFGQVDTRTLSAAAAA